MKAMAALITIAFTARFRERKLLQWMRDDGR